MISYLTAIIPTNLDERLDTGRRFDIQKMMESAAVIQIGIVNVQ
jgi:hypothetical protein